MYENSYTLKNLGGLITTNYILAIILAIVFIVLLYIIANAIPNESGENPKDPVKRRTWFIILAFICCTIFFLWNLLYVKTLIRGIPAVDKFLIQTGIATGVALIVYFITGIIVIKVSKRGSKINSIWPSKKRG